MPGIADVIKQYKSVVAGFLPASLIPALAGIAGLAPPRPDGIIAITTAYELIVLLLSYAIFRRQNFRLLRQILIASIIGSILLFLGYVVLKEIFVFAGPDGKQFVSGFQCTRDAQQVFRDECPFLSDASIAAANWDTERLFTAPSRAITTALLDAFWFGFFLMIAFAISSFAANEAVIRRPVARQNQN